MRSRHRSLVAVARIAVILGTGCGLAFGLGSFGGATVLSSPETSAVEQVVQEANNFVENEASPAPLGDTDVYWALKADLPVGGFRGYSALSETIALTHPEHRWVVNGRVHLLSNSEANAVITEQTADINRVFTGSLLQQMADGMTTMVEGETQSASTVPSPGGSAVVSWSAVDVSGSTAKVHCLEVEWLQVDNVTPATATSPARVRSWLARGREDERLTLRRQPDGQWKVLLMDATPLGPTG